jgi:hypothetical protein
VKRFTEPAPAPSSVRKEIAVWLDTVISKSVARNPEERYNSAEDLVRELGPQRSVERITIEPAAIDRTSAPQPSIGVIPVANMSASADNEYFSDGVTEDITTRANSKPQSSSEDVQLRAQGKALGSPRRDDLNVNTISRRKRAADGSARSHQRSARQHQRCLSDLVERYDRKLRMSSRSRPRSHCGYRQSLELKLSPLSIGAGQTPNRKHRATAVSARSPLLAY